MCLKLFILSQGKEDVHKYNFARSICESTSSNTTGRDLEERSLSGSTVNNFKARLVWKGFTF